jgi:hypothetical protein
MHGTSDSESVTEGINASTSWGWSTSTAIGANESLARTAQRSREFLVEPHQLQQLPPSAVIVSYSSPGGRQVVLADANPAILALPTVSTLSMDEARQARDARAGAPASGGQARAAGRQAQAQAAGRWQAPAGRATDSPAGAPAHGPAAGPGGGTTDGPAAGPDGGTTGGPVAGPDGGTTDGPVAGPDGGTTADPADGPERWRPGDGAPGAAPAGDDQPPTPVSWRSKKDGPPPNLGPPPEPLDWRKHRGP